MAALLKDYRGGEPISKGEAFIPSPANIETRVVRRRLASGLQVVMLPKKTLGGAVSARLNIRFGDEKSLAGQAAVAELASIALPCGAGKKDAQQIGEETERMKAIVSYGGDAASAFVHVETIESYLEGALRLEAEVLKEPSFPESGFEEARRKRLTAIGDRGSDPDTLASIEFMRHLHPYPPAPDLQ